MAGHCSLQACGQFLAVAAAAARTGAAVAANRADSHCGETLQIEYTLHIDLLGLRIFTIKNLRNECFITEVKPSPHSQYFKFGNDDWGVHCAEPLQQELAELVQLLPRTVPMVGTLRRCRLRTRFM